VTGGSKLKSVLMFRHMGNPENILSRRSSPVSRRLRQEGSLC
jgi:hypothetical protein